MIEKRYDLSSGKVFVFGSNLAGRHGKGAALYARQYLGAITGQGRGPMPAVETPTCLAIPTKDESLKILPLSFIRAEVRHFIAYAATHPDLEFFVTRIGCGLAGYNDEDISPFFKGSPVNCELPLGWLP
jgi:hypothetical protein